MNRVETPFAARISGWVLTIGGAVGFLAAFTLIVEKISLIKNPAYVPTCSINPLLSCGSVMQTSQAEAFGFPNPLIGVAAFPVVITIGVLVLAGVRLPRWGWLGLQTGTVFGLVFVHWLIYQSLYRIGALCPYCMVVWIVMITIFWYTLLRNLHFGVIPLRNHKTLLSYHGLILTAWLLIIAALIGIEFWDYWQTLL